MLTTFMKLKYVFKLTNYSIFIHIKLSLVFIFTNTLYLQLRIMLTVAIN